MLDMLSRLPLACLMREAANYGLESSKKCEMEKMYSGNSGHSYGIASSKDLSSASPAARVISLCASVQAIRTVCVNMKKMMA